MVFFLVGFGVLIVFSRELNCAGREEVTASVEFTLDDFKDEIAALRSAVEARIGE